MQGTLARVKVWTPDGRIVYSDAPSLIGQVFPLADDQAAALATGTMSEPKLSDLSAAENRLESSDERLVEVYVPIVAADGSSLLVESYLRPDGVLSSGRLVTEQLWPIVLAALAFLAIAQWPLAWRLATDLRVGHEARERLLRRAVDSSLAERRRIAADLHDGLVQSLAGVAYDLSGSADQATDPATAADLERGADGVRAAMQEARSVLVDLYPPNLAATGLATAVTDLGSNVATRGIAVTTAVTDDDSLGDTRQAVVYRVAQEALRNVVKHSAATHVAIRLDVSHGACHLRIEDDGVGLGQVDLADRRQAGHVGLAILHDLAREVGARLEIGPGHPRGTILALEMGGPR